MPGKQLPRSSLLSLGGMIIPIIVHGIHMLLPLILTGGISVTSSVHMQHEGASGGPDPFMNGIIIGITVISIVFTLWYLFRIWRSRECSRVAAWSYTGVSIVCFGLIAIVM